jgi:hypothetical protein
MGSLGNEPFPVRFGLENGPTIDNDFPRTARVGLWHILNRANRSGQIAGWTDLVNEILRLRRIRVDLEGTRAEDVVAEHLFELSWERVYVLCERVYSNILRPEIEHEFNGESYVVVEVEDVRGDFEADLNQLFAEEGIVYRMADGILYRPGRLHSQSVAAKATVVLRDPRLREARGHFAKAQHFFANVTNPDFANAIRRGQTFILRVSPASVSQSLSGSDLVSRYRTEGLTPKPLGAELGDQNARWK